MLKLLKLLKEIVTHPANRNAYTKSLVRAVHWQLSKRLSGRPLDISYHGKVLRCYPNNHSSSRAIYFSGLPDYREMSFMRDYLRPGDAFIDAGANVGLYTLLALSIVGEEGAIDAFEPTGSVANILRESLNLNAASNVTVHEVGLSDTTGLAEFMVTGDDCTSHIVTSPSESTGVQIPIDRLDNLLGDVPYAMIKFDIEGYEPFAVRGASKWTKKGNPPVMLIEMAGYSGRHGISTPEFISELDRLGYVTAVYDPEARVLQATEQPWTIPVDNILAIAKERLSHVERRIEDRGYI